MSTELNSLASAQARKPESGAQVYDDGRLRVEHENYYVACGASVLQLPRKEFLILSRLARNAQRIVSSAEIWQHAWPPAAPFNAESLHVHIYRLRRRLSPFRIHIETMVNVGYRLITTNE
ncbi:MAG TPA: winged helix-turn-helix domain-containing protein [Pyrinomonadaceae bacterium]|nr:winged helix-turn-helix domain-containing protein [Pyrinomonadaceae bacterium]